MDSSASNTVIIGGIKPFGFAMGRFLS